MENGTERLVLDKTLLTQDQRKEYQDWEDFFHGPGWKRLCQREEDTFDVLQRSYATVTGEQPLGFLQGNLHALTRLLVHLPDMIHAEFLMKTGQFNMGVDEDSDTENPVTPENWQV